MKIFQFIKFVKAVINTIFGRGAILLLPFLPGVASCQHSAFFNAGEPLLLDVVPGATAAYSIRKLSSTYTGSAVEVRRASDNATQQIGFYGGEIDLGVLTSFCNGTDCFVRTWYDQSGNGNHAIQTTAANQPKIWDSSTGVVLENGKPGIRFDGTDDYLIDYFTSANFYSIFSVSKHDTTATEKQLYLIRGSVSTKGTGVTINAFGNNGTISGSISDATNTRVANVSGNYTQNFNLTSIFANYTANTLTGYLNSTTLGGTDIARIASNSPLYGLSIGANGNDFVGQPIDGIFYELIMYDSDKTANRVAIETNVNNFFSIY